MSMRNNKLCISHNHYPKPSASTSTNSAFPSHLPLLLPWSLQKLMAFPEMGWSGCLKLVAFLALVVISELDMAGSSVHIEFDETPPELSRFSTAVFRYSVYSPDGSNACKRKKCSLHCQLDGKTLSQCPSSEIALRNLTVNQRHIFLLNATTASGETNSSAYSWFIDTIPPTATISSKQNYTNAEKISISVTFSEVCSGNGGFKCLNSSNCNVIINGPAYVDVSSLRVMEPNIKYRLDVILSSRSAYELVEITIEESFCTDMAGNGFTRTNSSTLVVHFDRRPVLVDLWTSVPSYELGINGVSRTVFATNKMDELKLFLDFSIPVLNSTEQIHEAFLTSSGNLVPIHKHDNKNRRFVFELKNIATTEIITVELQAGLIIGISGTAVSAVAPLTFLYDSTQPAVGLSTSSPRVTEESSINIIVEFTKPVFGFEASMIELVGGRLTRFKELSRALYLLIVVAESEEVVSIRVPDGKVNDISGNPNLASNGLEVKHYLKPPISLALHSFVTTGTLATSLAATVLSLSAANLEALGTLGSLGTTNVVADPSTNLHGMIGHLQVFVLSDWLLPNSPIEHSETMKGLRWLIPRHRLPWKRNSSLIWQSRFGSAHENLVKKHSKNVYYHQIDLNLTKNLCKQRKGSVEMAEFCGSYRQYNAKSYNGLPLSSGEYFTYFLRGEPLSARNVIQRMENYKGWEDLGRNMFWLGAAVGSFLIIHVLILLFLRRRTGKSACGKLSVPRFELFLLILMLPCLSQSSAFVIRGGTTWGIITGALLLAIVAAFILSVSLFLIVAVFSGSFTIYKEVRHEGEEHPLYQKLLFSLFWRGTSGKWSYREGLSLSFISRFGILFEDRKGPPVYILVDQRESSEEIKVRFATRIAGYARSSYIIIDLIRRVSLGFLAGIHRSDDSSQTLSALIITLIQLLYLFILRPYIGRGVQAAETISLSCEAALFGLSNSTLNEEKLGFVMLALLFATLVAQLTNAWYALSKSMFTLGIKDAFKGFVLPFLPRSHWSNSLQPKTVLPPVLPLYPETDFQQRDRKRASRVESFHAMTATVVPVYSPGRSPSAGEQIEMEARRAKGIKGESKDDIKKLRQLAKASFSKDSYSQADDGLQASTSNNQRVI